MSQDIEEVPNLRFGTFGLWLVVLGRVEGKRAGAGVDAVRA